MVETRLKWFECVWGRLVDFVVRRVHQVEGNPVARRRGIPRKTIGKTLKKDLDRHDL